MIGNTRLVYYFFFFCSATTNDVDGEITPSGTLYSDSGTHYCQSTLIGWRLIIGKFTNVPFDKSLLNNPLVSHVITRIRGEGKYSQ